jgi:hypothetical protein
VTHLIIEVRRRMVANVTFPLNFLSFAATLAEEICRAAI